MTGIFWHNKYLTFKVIHYIGSLFIVSLLWDTGTLVCYEVRLVCPHTLVPSHTPLTHRHTVEMKVAVSLSVITSLLDYIYIIMHHTCSLIATPSPPFIRHEKIVSIFLSLTGIPVGLDADSIRLLFLLFCLLQIWLSTWTASYSRAYPITTIATVPINSFSITP